MIVGKTLNNHWNYYLAIENDLEKVSRFIEFNEDNLDTYSIELAHILLSTASEIDVLLKQICKKLSPSKNYSNITAYRKLIKVHLPELIDEKVYIHRFGIEMLPWSEWKEDNNPYWWQIHNKVKHQRNIFFKEANLQNTLNAVGALLIVVNYYYKFIIQERYDKKKSNININLRSTTQHLNPKSSLLFFKNEYYQYPVYFYDK